MWISPSAAGSGSSRSFSACSESLQILSWMLNDQESVDQEF
jgi:hypothetical protein